MVYTIAANPSVNYIAQVPGFSDGGSYKPDEDQMYPGGKGINIARVLKVMGIESTATGFLGGATGAYVNSVLEAEKVNTAFVKIGGNTRINVKVIGGGKETSIYGSGPEILKTDCDKIIEKLAGMNSSDFLVMAGDVNGTAVEDLYICLADYCCSNQIPFAVYCDGLTLSKTVKYRPFFVKPTYEELGTVFDTVILTKDAIYSYGRELVRAGVQNVIVSMKGLDGAVMLTEDEIYTSNLPQGEIINTSGARDAMVAGFIASCYKGGAVLEAFRSAVAAGGATAFSNYLTSYEKFLDVYEGIEVTPLEQSVI